MVKKKPDIVITKGKHTLITKNNHTGKISIEWDWDKLLEEIKEATNLVKVTETKVKRIRKKKKDNNSL